MQITYYVCGIEKEEIRKHFNQEFQSESERLEDPHVDEITKLHYNYTKNTGR